MSPNALQDRFLTHLPRIKAHARFAFNQVGCPHARADLEAETIALAWKHFVALVQRRKNPEAFITTLAMRCAQAAGAGRKVAGGFRKRETLPQPGVEHGTRTRIPLAEAEHAGIGWLSDALREDTRTPVPQRVAFQIDFGAWRAALPEKKRALLDALASGGKTGEVAHRFGICPARVSQMRREFAEGWRAFRNG